MPYIVWLQHYCLILLYFINENRFKQSPSQAAAHLQSNTAVFLLWMNDSFLNESSESMIQLPIKTVAYFIPEWISRSNESIE